MSEGTCLSHLSSELPQIRPQQMNRELELAFYNRLIGSVSPSLSLALSVYLFSLSSDALNEAAFA